MQIMKLCKMVMIGCIAAAPFIFVACDNDDDDNNAPALTTLERNFMTQASYGNHAEIEMGKVADSISAHDSVEVFAQMMVMDHTTAQVELADIGNDWNISLPDKPDSLHMAMKQAMMMLSGTTFDTAYINGQINDHIKTVALFQMAVDSSKNGTVKAYASKYLPKIQMHLEHVQRIKMLLP
jgi:putative membrane protein